MTLVNLLGDAYAVSDTSSPSFTGQVSLLGSGSSTGLLFGSTAQAKIYVSADTTAGHVIFTRPTTGSFLFNGTTRPDNGGQDNVFSIFQEGVASSDADGGTFGIWSSTAATSGGGVGAGLTFGGYYSGSALYGTWGRIRGPKLNNTDGNYGGGLAFDTRANGSGFAQVAEFTSLASIALGTQSALATNATDGFVYIRGGAGTPTGAPTAITGLSPLYVDTTNHKLYFYSGGSWRDAGP